MRHFALHTDIAADLKQVWELLVRLEEWPRWNRLVPTGVGDVRVGETLDFRIRKVGKGFRRHRPMLTEVIAPRTLTLAADFGVGDVR